MPARKCCAPVASHRFPLASSCEPPIESFVFNTPTPPIQCSQNTVTWEGGVAPFTFRRNFDRTFVIDSGIAERSRTWFVNLPSDTEIEYVLEDSTGAKAPSVTVVVQPSTETGCL
ncbi:hypothetical protein C8Q78DRAFT_1152659 [Trametes maxima]|nr:hypothetical protein C8Q78DRAFT_1152659 [Trametes maxima]